MPRRDTLEGFLSKARAVHGDKYDYSLVDYQKSTSKVKIVCETHGEFMQTPTVHINKGGCGCPTCGLEVKRVKRIASDSEILRRVRAAHGDRFYYPDQHLTGMNGKMLVVCSTHGEFATTPYQHIHNKGGCAKCGYVQGGEKIKMSFDDFITLARGAHGDKYNYDRESFTGSTRKTRIQCLTHGWFEQAPVSHHRGNGCPACASESKKGKWQVKTMPEHVKVQQCSFYYIKLWSDREVFYKVGISSDMPRRMNKFRKSGYAVEVVHAFEGSRGECATFEEDVITTYRPKFRYQPMRPLQGHTECFSVDVLGLDNQSKAA